MPFPEPEHIEPGDAVDGAVGESGVQEVEAVEPEPEPEVEPRPGRPSVGDPKADWEDYVESLGGDPFGMTKAELQAEADRLESG